MSNLEFEEDNIKKRAGIKTYQSSEKSSGLLSFFQKIGLAKSENAANAVAIIFILIFFTASILIYVFFS